MISEPVDYAGVILVRRDGSILLQQRDTNPLLRHAGHWVPPGGAREAGESVEQCARRELFEETGYRCERLVALGVAALPDDKSPGLLHYAAMFAASYDETQEVRCYEGRAVCFVDIGTATDLGVMAEIMEMAERARAVMRSETSQMDGAL